VACAKLCGRQQVAADLSTSLVPVSMSDAGTLRGARHSSAGELEGPLVIVHVGDETVALLTLMQRIRAYKGQADGGSSLNLQSVGLRVAPDVSPFSALRSLDLSRNVITTFPELYNNHAEPRISRHVGQLA
jgi:hypothetical protein